MAERKYVTDVKYGGFDFYIGKPNPQFDKGYYNLKGFLPQLNRNAPDFFTDEYIDQVAIYASPMLLAEDEDMSDPRAQLAFYYVWLGLNGLFNITKHNITYEERLLMFKYTRLFNMPISNYPSMIYTEEKSYQAGGMIEMEYIPYIDQEYVKAIRKAVQNRDALIIKASIAYLYWLDERAEKARYEPLEKGRLVPWVYQNIDLRYTDDGSIDHVGHPIVFSDKENDLIIELGTILIRERDDIRNITNDAKIRKKQWSLALEKLNS